MLEPGLVGEITHIVTEAETAATYGSGLVPTLSTPHLVALMENAARETVQAYLPEHQSTVGTVINMQHLAPTPVGMEVRLRAEVLSVEGRRLRLHVEAWDAVERIGVCEHERFIIDWERFMQRVAEKEHQICG
ncbi:MAG TPA: thioesterase family protein [Thermoflexia bacterium]|nr:thioesterase family protein [Thermoflexia bacterium]